MKILILARKGESLTGGGTYQANVLRELAKRHTVKVYESAADLDEEWDLAHCLNLKHLSPDVARKLRCPLVVDSHDYYWVRYYHFFCLDFPVRFLLQQYRKFKYKQLFQHIDGIILHGQYVYDLYDHPHKYLNFYYGLDYSEIESRPWEEKENLILFVGGDYFRKGIHRLLRALPLVLKKVPDARLMVIGNDYGYVKAFARLLARGLPVEFVYGMPRAELYKTYGKAKAFVMPSEIEAIPLVSSEATMAGVPPILSDAGGNPEIVLDGKTGFVVPLDDYSLLAERIVECLTDKELSESLVVQGRAFLGQFTAERMIGRLEEIYELVLRVGELNKPLQLSTDHCSQGETMADKKTGILERDSFYIVLMTVIIIGFFGRILFTDQIIRASDVVTQFFWGAKALKEQSLLQFIRSIPEIFRAGWDTLSDGGRTLEGGWNAIGLLFHRYFIQHFFPFPSCIAWLVVLAMCWGAIGTFLYCRLIGVSRLSAFAAGLLYVICTENASLINAGHIQKFEAICWFPWILLFLEKALRSGRFYHYALTALMLAIQFFHMHWQISFYSCLVVGAYWIWNAAGGFREQEGAPGKRFSKNFLLAIAMVALFFTTIAMSFAPLYSWSQQSERGEAVSGSTGQGATKGAEKGIGYDEGMSWSIPPEELLTFLVPGLFGYSRQEGGDVPAPGQVYYWGRMRFTQTSDYLGLLPWFLLPLPLFFRRDRYTFFLTFLMAATMIMALGKYTFVYRFMFEHLPAFSSFRVPKMILFLFAFGAAVLAGRGMDVLADEAVERKQLGRWVWWCGGVTACIGLITLLVSVAGQPIMAAMAEFITAPTRYQNSPQLVGERLNHMFRDAAISCGVAAVYLATILAWFRRWLPTRLFLPLLVLLALSDLWRVNSRFLVVTPPPAAKKEAAKNDIVTYLKPRIDHYRMQPLNDENAHYYADNGFANVSAYVTISERRYKQFLDVMSLMSPMPDIMNLKYLVMKAADFEAQKNDLGKKYLPVFTSANGSVVLENKAVLPKAWLVPSVAVVADPKQRLEVLATAQNFIPEQVALVETPPPLQLEAYPSPVVAPAGSAAVTVYEANRIVVEAQALKNSLLVIGEKYYRWWSATVDGKKTEIVPVNHVLRGVYLSPGKHKVEFVFDPLPFKIGKWLTLASLAFFAVMVGWEWRRTRD